MGEGICDYNDIAQFLHYSFKRSDGVQGLEILAVVPMDLDNKTLSCRHLCSASVPRTSIPQDSVQA